MIAEHVDPLIETIESIVAVMDEESAILSQHGPVPGIEELGAAKTRLAGRMELQVAQLFRAWPAWTSELVGEDRSRLSVAYDVLHRTSALNSAILERHIDLSTEMLAAVGKEIERQSGRGTTTYGRYGQVHSTATRAPLSVNTRY